MQKSMHSNIEPGWNYIVVTFRRPDNQIKFLRFILSPCKPTSFSFRITAQNFPKILLFKKESVGKRRGDLCVYGTYMCVRVSKMSINKA